MASTTHILNRAPGMAGQLLLNLRDASRHEDRAAFRWNMQRMGRELGKRLGAIVADGEGLVHDASWHRHRRHSCPPTRDGLHPPCRHALAPRGA